MQTLINTLKSKLPKEDPAAKQPFMKSPLPYYMVAALILTALPLDLPNPFPFLALLYAGFPLLDQFFGLDQTNPDKPQRLQLQHKDPVFRMALYLAMILDWAMFIKLMRIWQNFEPSWTTLLHMAALAFTAANLYTAQFLIAHEVMHKPGRFYRVIATLHMVKLYYPHFTQQHLTGHHRWVGTPRDPSSARKGENVYSFVVRSVLGSWRNVYEEERKVGKGVLENNAVLSLISTCLFASFVWLVFGLRAMTVHSLTALTAIVYLEGVNYLEHYGLTRKLLPNGDYEKVTILHSWNAPHKFTNYLLFKVQRHSDHHENASKPYQTLASLERSPFLPHGYTLMILMAFFPKVWFRIMDPMVDAYSKLKEGQVVQAEVVEKAKGETSRFLVEIAGSATLLFVLSMCGVI